MWGDVVSELNGDLTAISPIPPHQRRRSAPSPDPSAKSLAQVGQAADDRRGVCPTVRAEQFCAERDRTAPAQPDHRRTEPPARSTGRTRCPHRAPEPRRRSTTCPIHPSTSSPMTSTSKPTKSMTTAKPWPAPHESWPSYFNERPRNGRHRPARGHQPQPSLHVRHLRHRRVQPIRARGRPGHRRSAGPRLQPVVHLGRVRAG